jgi:hypothetical protein
MIVYANKGVSLVHKKFHPMEGECYALVWGIMHFQYYLYQNHFTLHTNHKPLEWLATMLNTYGRRGRWINTLQDFNFKIICWASSRHTNVDAFSWNPIDIVDEWEDLIKDIQDCKLVKLGCLLKETL